VSFPELLRPTRPPGNVTARPGKMPGMIWRAATGGLSHLTRSSRCFTIIDSRRYRRFGSCFRSTSLLVKNRHGL